MADVRVDILGDSGQLVGEVEKSTRSLKDMGKSLSDVGGTMTKWVSGPIVGAVGGLALFGKQLISNADELFNLSEKAGLGTTALQELKHVGEITGVEIEAITNASGRFAKVITDSERGLSTATDALDTLGISVYDSTGAMRSQDDLFRQAIKSLQGMEDETRKMGLAQEVFGRGGKEMIPILNLTADSMNDLTDEAHDLGIVMGEDMVKSLDAMDDDLTRVTTALKGAGVQIGQDLMPLMQGLIDFLVTDGIPIIKSVGEWVGEWIKYFSNLSPEMKTVIGVVAGLAAAAGPVAVVLGTIATIISGPLIIGIGAAVGVIAGITAAIVYWDDITKFLMDTYNSFRDALGFLAYLVPVIGPIIAVIENWDAITKVLLSTWNAVTGTLETVGGWLGFIEDEGTTAMEGITTAAQDMETNVKASFASVDASAQEHFTGNTVLAAGVAAMEGITAAAQAMSGDMKNILGGIDSIFGTTFQGIFNKGMRTFNSLSKAFSSLKSIGSALGIGGGGSAAAGIGGGGSAAAGISFPALGAPAGTPALAGAGGAGGGGVSAGGAAGIGAAAAPAAAFAVFTAASLGAVQLLGGDVGAAFSPLLGGGSRDTGSTSSGINLKHTRAAAAGGFRGFHTPPPTLTGDDLARLGVDEDKIAAAGVSAPTINVYNYGNVGTDEVGQQIRDEVRRQGYGGA